MLVPANPSFGMKKDLKMLHLIGPDGLVNLGFVNFQKMVWMTMVHVLIVWKMTPGFDLKFTSMLFLRNLHILGLQCMQNIIGFVTNSILRPVSA